VLPLVLLVVLVPPVLVEGLLLLLELPLLDDLLLLELEDTVVVTACVPAAGAP
jgi:hypothetical protein